jgi:hypothetical protein
VAQQFCIRLSLKLKGDFQMAVKSAKYSQKLAGTIEPGTFTRHDEVSGIHIIADSQADVALLIEQGVINISNSLMLAAQPTLRLVDVELSIDYVGTVTVAGSLAAVRGATTIGADSTIAGASYLYGVQGKLINKGIHSGTAEVSAALVGQLDLSASLGVTAPIACVFADCGATAGTVTAAAIDGVVVYNTTAAKINAALRIDTNSNYLFDLSDEGGGHGAGNWIIATAKSSGWDKSLKIKINGTAYYIPCNSAAS